MVHLTGYLQRRPGATDRALKKKLGFNDSALHWDLVNTEQKTVTAHLTNGKRVLIYDRGVSLFKGLRQEKENSRKGILQDVESQSKQHSLRNIIPAGGASNA